ncbi:hypothetical protein L6466_09725 [Prevotella communis]|uniref:hypothetical protein n=1 Tax=Prevotella communis TaxID=2913614 RepID=UPI001EDB5980|nr:hypothetical protein [Prevotella communis]UKK60274.1 hypothetical protein L6470_04480 [Prevotella communis]UKK63007.1 hypothetical protein L6468_04355 [Prevotella communis]UKK65832.1 hypothetical protein L6473_04355 [Prevotella communis]UKK68262.1 hypothetical protein L6464_02755 [Prevotella communis]UKK69603.1 hypothetical protein L6466_09725 [Prevotella communis]
MGFHIKNNYGPNIEVNAGGKLTLVQDKNGLWHTVEEAEIQEAEYKELPEVLATDKAMALWRKAQQAGYVDEHYQPLISRTQAALLADAMAERLGIKEKWKVFEGFWNRNYMRSDYNLALTRKKTLDFLDELKVLFD